MKEVTAESNNYSTFRSPLRGFETGVSEGINALNVDRTPHAINFFDLFNAPVWNVL